MALGPFSVKSGSAEAVTGPGARAGPGVVREGPGGAASPGGHGRADQGPMVMKTCRNQPDRREVVRASIQGV